MTKQSDLFFLAAAGAVLLAIATQDITSKILLLIGSITYLIFYTISAFTIDRRRLELDAMIAESRMRIEELRFKVISEQLEGILTVLKGLSKKGALKK